MRRILGAATLFAWMTGLSTIARGQSTDAPASYSESTDVMSESQDIKANEPTATSAATGGRSTRWTLAYYALGESQFWSDEYERAGYRIQRSSESERYRLLSPTGARLTSGDYAACEAKLNEIAATEDLPEHTREIVILLHGLCRTRASMASLGRYVEEETDLEAVSIGYASSRESIDAHAATLERMLARMPEVEKVHFVGHSMGNLVVRRFLARRASGIGPQDGPEIGRIVMIAPPNQGSRVAAFFVRNPLFNMIWGHSGKQIAGWTSELQRELEIPDDVEFGIVAGSNEWGQGYNPLLTGNDDLIVSVDETKLPGAADFRVTPALHSFIMHDKTVKRLTARFLLTGLFGAPDEAQPLPKATVAVDADRATEAGRR